MRKPPLKLLFSTLKNTQTLTAFAFCLNVLITSQRRNISFFIIVATKNSCETTVTPHSLPPIPRCTILYVHSLLSSSIYFIFTPPLPLFYSICLYLLLSSLLLISSLSLARLFLTPRVVFLTDGCPGLCNNNGRCVLDQNVWHCICQSGWRGLGCDVATETLCSDGKDNEGGRKE